MYYKLIENNINKLTSKNTKNYLESNNIYLNDNQYNILTKLVKNNWKDLYNKEYDIVLKQIKTFTTEEETKKILELYLQKINQYLN